MTHKCCMCKEAAVSCWIPIDPCNVALGSYPVCSSSRCKFLAWNIPTPKDKNPPRIQTRHTSVIKISGI